VYCYQYATIENISTSPLSKYSTTKITRYQYSALPKFRAINIPPTKIPLYRYSALPIFRATNIPLSKGALSNRTLPTFLEPYILTISYTYITYLFIYIYLLTIYIYLLFPAAFGFNKYRSGSRFNCFCISLPSLHTERQDNLK
jgi:hypothetical protein